MSAPTRIDNDSDEALPEQADGQLHEDDDREAAEASTRSSYSPDPPLVVDLRQRIHLQNTSEDPPRRNLDPESAESLAAYMQYFLEVTRVRTSGEMMHHQPDHNPQAVPQLSASTAQPDESPSESHVPDISMQGHDPHASESQPISTAAVGQADETAIEHQTPRVLESADSIEAWKEEYLPMTRARTSDLIHHPAHNLPAVPQLLASTAHPDERPIESRVPDIPMQGHDPHALESQPTSAAAVGQADETTIEHRTPRDLESADSIEAWKEDILELTRTPTSDILHHPEPSQALHSTPAVPQFPRSTTQPDEHPSPSYVPVSLVQSHDSHALEGAIVVADGLQQEEAAVEHHIPSSSFASQAYPGAVPPAETPYLAVAQAMVFPEATAVTIDDQDNKLKHLRLFIDEDLIEEHNQKFVHGTREWFARKFDAWVAEKTSSSRVFCLAANAGIGKTTMMSWLVRHRADVVLAHHFCQHDISDYRDPKRMLLSLSYQLCQRLPGFKSRVLEHTETYNLTRARLLESDEFNVASIFQQFLRAPLKASSQQVGDNIYVIVIDALDEMTSDCGRKNDLLACIEKHFDKLPRCIKVCIATRPEAPILTLSRQGDALCIGGPLKKFHPFVLEPTATENMSDIRIYLKVQLERPLHELDHCNVSADIPTAVDILARKSEGYFIYCEYAVLRLRELLLDQTCELNRASLEAFPDDMEAFYREQLGRVLPHGADSSFHRIVWQTLRLVAAAKEPLHIDLLQKLIQCSHTELHAAKEALSKLLPIRSGRVETYHKSFVDWLVKPSRKGDAYHIDLQKARDEIAELCLAELENLGNLATTNATYWSRLRENIKEDRAVEYYLLRYSLKHYLECSPTTKASLDSRARSLMINIDIMLGRVGLGDLFGHSQDCRAFGRSSSDRVVFLIGRALELSLDVVAKDQRLFQGQLIGRLLGPAKNAVAGTEIGELKQLTSKWKLKQFGFPWWCPLVPSWDQADSSCLRVLLNDNGVNSVAWSPDGKHVAFCSVDNPVQIWEVATGKCGRILEGHTDWVKSVAWSPDGKLIASCSSDKSVRIWEVETGQCQRSFAGHTDGVNTVAWSPDGKQIASCSEDMSVRIWEVETGQCQEILKGHSSLVKSVAWSPDGKHVASGSDDSSVRTWEVGTGRCQRVLEGHTNRVNSVAWSPDGKHVASSSEDESVRIWEVEIGQCQRILEGHTNWVNSVAWSPNGKHVASCSYDKSVRIWEVETGQCQRVLEGHSALVDSVAWSPNGKHVASGSFDKSVRIWDVETVPCQRNLEGHIANVGSVAWSPDGKHVASGSDDSSVRIWEVETGQFQRVLEGHTNRVLSVAWSPDGKHVASCSYDKTVRIWEVDTGQCQRIFEGHNALVYSVAWSPDGKHLVSCSEDWSVRIWPVETGQCQRILEGHTNRVNSVAWSPDGKYVASCSWDTTVRIWEVETGQCQRILEGHTHWVNSVAWSPDGKHVASCSVDKSVRIWEVETGQCQRILEGHNNWVDSVEWSPGGKQIASKSITSIRMWSVLSGACLAELPVDSGFPPLGFQNGFGTKMNFGAITNTTFARVSCDSFTVFERWACGINGNDLLFFKLVS